MDVSRRLLWHVLRYAVDGGDGLYVSASALQLPCRLRLTLPIKGRQLQEAIITGCPS